MSNSYALIMLRLHEPWALDGAVHKHKYLYIVCRTGKRTPIGALMDGWNSVVRYIRNNFQDGYRQVCQLLTSQVHHYEGSYFRHHMHPTVCYSYSPI